MLKGGGADLAEAMQNQRCASVYLRYTACRALLGARVKSCCCGTLVISAIAISDFPSSFMSLIYETIPWLPVQLRKTQGIKNSVVPPLLNRLCGHSSGSSSRNPLNAGRIRAGFSSSGRATADRVSFLRVRSQTAFSRGGLYGAEPGTPPVLTPLSVLYSDSPCLV